MDLFPGKIIRHVQKRFPELQPFLKKTRPRLRIRLQGHRQKEIHEKGKSIRKALCPYRHCNPDSSGMPVLILLFALK